MDKIYSDDVKLLAQKTAIGLSKSKPEIVKPLLDETKFLDVIDPTFTIRKYCIENNIHSIPLCECCGQIVGVNKKDHKLGFNRFCSDSCRKQMSKIPLEALKCLQDKDWLYNERITLKKSKDAIASELGISWPTVDKWIIFHDIDIIKYNESQIDFSNTLKNYEWLFNNYIELERSISSIATELNTSESMVSKYLLKFDIQRRSGSENQLSKTAYDKLNDANWLNELYNMDGESTYTISQQLGVTDKTVGTYLAKHCIPIKKNKSTSTYEYTLKEYIESFGIDVIQSCKDIISPYQLDLYIPSHKIAIEINGLYWHSEKFRNKDYHLFKYNMCKNNGIRLIHFYEDDIIERFEILKKIITNALGVNIDKKIYARKCIVKYNINKELMKSFFTENHIQGYCNHNYNVGLFCDNILVAAMLFNENVLSRYTTSCKVIGGLSKLIKHSNVSIIDTFLDIQTFTGESYLKNGFDIIGELQPDYKYVKNNKRIHKFNFRKSKFKNDCSLFYDENMTEHQLAIANKLYRIYDCGKLKLRYKKRGI